MKSIIYKSVIISILDNGLYTFVINGIKHTDTNIHMAKRMITKTIKFLNEQNINIIKNN